MTDLTPADAARLANIRDKYRGLQGDMPPFGDVLTLLGIIRDYEAELARLRDPTGDATEVAALAKKFANEHWGGFSGPVHAQQAVEALLKSAITAAEARGRQAERERLNKPLGDAPYTVAELSRANALTKTLEGQKLPFIEETNRLIAAEFALSRQAGVRDGIERGYDLAVKELVDAHVLKNSPFVGDDTVFSRMADFLQSRKRHIAALAPAAPDGGK